MQPGRPRSGLWANFEKFGPPSHPRARCRGCGEEMAGQPERLRAHQEKCKKVRVVGPDDQTGSENVKTPSSSSSSPACPPAKRQCQRMLCPATTTEANRAALDLQLCRFVLATAIPFRVVEHPEFKTLISMLRPGCRLSGERAVAGDLLESVYSDRWTLPVLPTPRKTLPL